MTSTDRVCLACILFGVNLAMAIGANAAGELSPTPAGETSEDTAMMWLKTTVLPLGVTVIGACIWGCIKNSCTSLMERRRVSNAPETDANEMAARLPNTSSQHESDLEEGNAASHRGVGDDSEISTGAGEMMHQRPLQSANDEGNLPASVDVATQP